MKHCCDIDFFANYIYNAHTWSKSFTPFLHDAVGNKNDDPKSKVVETADAQKFAEQMDIRLFETSAKENLNVEDVSKTVKQQDLCWNCAQEF